jgi:hypothetical protein
MKTFCKIVVIPCVLILALSSCNQKSKDVSMKANATTRAFVEKMVKGETTREQEQAFIRVVADITISISSTQTFRNRRFEDFVRSGTRLPFT